MQPPPNQPPYSNYYRGAPGYYGMPPGPPEVDLKAISRGWDLNTKNLRIWAVAMLVLVLVAGTVGLPGSYLANMLVYGEPFHIRPLGAPLFTPQYAQVEGIVAFYHCFAQFVLGTLTAGMVNMAYMMWEGRQVTIGDMFSGFSRFGSVGATAVLVSLLTYVGTLCCIVPGFYLAGALAFAPLIALRQNVGPVEAIKRSMNTLKGGQAWMMFLLLFLGGLLSALGVLACCVGFIVTGATVFCALGITYYNFFPPATPVPSGPMPPMPNMPPGPPPYPGR